MYGIKSIVGNQDYTKPEQTTEAMELLEKHRPVLWEEHQDKWWVDYMMHPHLHDHYLHDHFDEDRD